MRALIAATSLMAILAATPASAEIPDAKDILMTSVAIPTVEGRGNVPRLAAYYVDILKAAGYQDSDLVFTPIGETGYFTATLKGRAHDKPIVLLGHMDVVEAKAEDWTRDPFRPVEENGYIYGRGAEDNKYDVAMMVTTMARLKQEGFRPRQDIVLVLTGDEETAMKTTAAAAQKYRHAGLVLNGDAGGGTIKEDGTVPIFSLQAAEKTYADFTVTLTDPGGHSSAPTATNPIYRLVADLARLGAYKFPPMQNELTRAALAHRAKSEDAETRRTIEAFLANPADVAAADRLSARPEYIGQIRTTCVATMVNAGHAPNALPQRASANINCRIFPGVSIASVSAEIERVIADPQAKMEVRDNPLASDASPLRKDVMKAVTDAVARRFPGATVVPAMSAGATDSLYFRALGVPAYGVASLAMKESDSFAHGLNERAPTDRIDSALVYWHDLVTALAK